MTFFIFIRLVLVFNKAQESQMFPLKLIRVQDLKILSGLKAQLQRSANFLSELNLNTTCFRAHNEIKLLYFTKIDTIMSSMSYPFYVADVASEILGSFFSNISILFEGALNLLL